jgi:hypothetical protein
VAAELERQSNRMAAEEPAVLVPAGDEDRRLDGLDPGRRLEQRLLRDAPDVIPEPDLSLRLGPAAVADPGADEAHGTDAERRPSAEPRVAERVRCTGLSGAGMRSRQAKTRHALFKVVATGLVDG